MNQEKICVFTKNWIGDLIMQTPCFRILKENFPNVLLVAVVPENSTWITKNNPFIDEVIIFNEKKQKGIIQKIKFVLTLKKHNFSKVFLLHRSKTRAFLCLLAGIPERFGYNTKGRAAFLTKAIKESKQPQHQTDYFVELLKQSGLDIPKEYFCEFYPTEEEIVLTEELWKNEGLNSGVKAVALNPGANWAPKRWSPDYFAELADRCHEEYGFQVIITGSESDQVLAEQIIDKAQVAKPVSLCGKTNFGVLGACFERCSLVVSADSGPMHIASSVGTPVFALFGPTKSWNTASRGKGKTVVMQAEQDDMNNLKPEEVFKRIKEETDKPAFSS